ncbi:MAG: hypothetical protein ACLQVD_22490 [Capsulimonadaceae bacterium]
MNNSLVSTHPIGPIRNLTFDFGASVALMSMSAPNRREIIRDQEMAITPGVLDFLSRMRVMEQQMRPNVESDSAEVWEESIIDYSYMDRLALAAANAPDIDISDDEKRMYAGLGDAYYEPGPGYDEE